MTRVVWVQLPTGGDRRSRPGRMIDPRELACEARRLIPAIPADRDLVEAPANGAAGWALRQYGDGFLVDRSAPGFFCPLALWVEPGRPLLSYAFALDWTGSPGRQETGERLRVAADTSRAGTESGVVSGLSRPAFERDAGGADEVVFFGTGRISASRPCLAGLSLFGGGSGYRVLWFAASQSSGER